MLPELLPVSRDKMGETYAELHRDWERISTVAYAEEDAFRQTLRAGTTIFDLAAAEVKQAGGTQLSGDRAFALHDTYGFPIDLTLEMAVRAGARGRRGRLPPADERAARPRQGGRQGQEGRSTATPRRTARSPTRWAAPVEFTGYDEVVSEGAVRGLVAADGVGRRPPARATRSSWSSTARRSTPRAAASSPTRASSSSSNGARRRGRPTCSRRSPG